MSSMSPTTAVVGLSDGSPSAESVSPRQPVAPKNVAFELMFVEAPQYRARLPMRVQIYPHDTTDSIVTTVKNFYGLYSGPTGSKGVSFEDKEGNTLIARYENFVNNMIVYVRVFEEFSPEPAFHPHPTYQHSAPSTQLYYQPSGYHSHSASHDATRQASRSPRRRSPSPIGSRGRRSDSVSNASQKRRSRSSKNRSALSQADSYSDHQYSSDDDAPSTTSGRAKEQLGTTDISVDNIVEGGRRKRAKFESSELPLFAPPQMPAATSNPSVSPARRIEQHRAPLTFTPNGHNPFTNPRPLQAAQSYNRGVQPNMYTASGHEGGRSRANSSLGGNGGILPTPDPTVGSCMSEEDKDVALQLMRLGDMSNISHGRTSASTLDDTFSGKADAASSTGATSDGESESEDELPAARRQKLDTAGTSQHIYPTTEARFVPSGDTKMTTDEVDYDMHAEVKTVKNSKSAPKPKNSSIPKPVKSMKVSTAKAKKAPSIPGVPISPASQPPSRKQSIASTTNPTLQGEDDQPDLSTKPRCQRCRKSKKGCDRQRPCGRCRDAGLSADQCISEDEGNGRKGRYGRHMGVPIKKDEIAALNQPTLLPAAPIAPSSSMMIDKAKKRKR